MAVIVSEIWRYPVKSLGGQRMPRAWAGSRGFDHDRRWMVVRPDGLFLTQRELPLMATIWAAVHDGELQLGLKADDHPTLSLDAEPAEGEPIIATVFGDQVASIAAAPAADRWLSRVLSSPCRLAYMPAQSLRQVDLNYAPPGQGVSFADGFPYLVLSEASLAALNERMELPLPMNRFRPNIVLKGAAPFEEDQHPGFTAAGLHLKLVKPCGRCVITSTDQETGSRGAEPLATLSQWRKVGNKVIFGQNALLDGPQGWLQEGEELTWSAT